MAEETGNETKKCPYCAETIQATAIVCRYCGKDLRAGPPAQAPAPKQTNIFVHIWQFYKWVTLAIIGLLILLCCCVGMIFVGASINKNLNDATTPAAINGGAAPASVAPVETAVGTSAGPTVYHVGDTATLNDHEITLNSAKINAGILDANFTIKNTGNKEMSVSALFMQAKASDGTSLDIDIFDCPSTWSNPILPSDLSRGDACWKGANTQGAKIYYTPGFFGSVTIVWQVP